MGVVYEAVGPLGVRVALKVIVPERLSPSLLVRFRHEARTMMDLAHPNLARFFDYDESAAGPFFTMRLLPGTTLADRLTDLRLDPIAGVRLMIRTADAVAYLHARGLVHRDLKPSNILIDERGEPHVSDFGLIKDLAAGDSDGEGTPATPAGGGSATLTRAGARLGTEAYMSPEQFAGDHARVGPATDVWALGVILHELAWGARPKLDNHQLRLADDDSSSPVRTGLRPIVTRCLAWDPADRYATAADLGADLEGLLAPPVERPSRRRFVLAGGAGMLGLGAIGATWWAGLWPRGRDQSNPPADALEEIRRGLTDSGSVDLLRPDGTWRWSDWSVGPGEWTVADGVGGFDAPKGRVRLLEIASGLPGFGYRLAIRLRNVLVGAGPGGQVGVYVGRSLQTSAQGPSHCLVAVAMLDHGLDPDPAGQPRVSRKLVVRGCMANRDGGFFDAPAVDEPRPEPGVPGDWLDVAVTLDMNHLPGRAGDRQFRQKTRNQLLPFARQLGFNRPGFEALTPTFHPSEGLGVFAESARIEVAAARLERVDPT
jgi:hypothetical protein